MENIILKDISEIDKGLEILQSEGAKTLCSAVPVVSKSFRYA